MREPPDRELLARLSSEVAPREGGLRGLLHSIHRTPPLRDRVTLESVALAPVAERTADGWALTSLLAVPGRPAWAAVRWSWPGEQVLALTEMPRDGAAAGGWAAAAADDVAALVAALEAGLADDGFDPASLAPLYARALPPAARDRYAELVPDAAWIAPSDRGPSLDAQLAEAEQLAREHGVVAVDEQLAALRRRRLLPGVRVAVVGEPKRGKSFLVNALLGSDVLPSGATRPALPPVSVVAGSRPRLELARRDGRRAERPLDAASWDELARAADIVAVRCFVDSDWLRDLDAELVDTPAINDSPERTTLVQRTLDVCDAAVLVISAAAPLSLTERAFLEREVLGRRIGRIALVTSHVHAVAADDVDGVLAFIAERAAALSPDLHAGVLDPDDPAALRALVAALAGRSDRALWRARQHSEQLRDAVDALAEAGRQGVAGAKLDAEQRRAAIAAAEQDTERRKLSWERTRIELDRRRIALAGALRAQLAETRGAVVEGLMREAERAPDAGKWWNRDLPWRLEQELSATARNLNKTLVDGLDADLAWLDGKLEGGGHAPRKRADLDAPRTADKPQVDKLGLRDLDRWRLFTRAGSGVATIVGALLFPPAGIALGITAAVAGELHLRDASTEQREHVRTLLAGVVDGAMRTHGDAIQARLADFYAQLLDDLAAKRDAWERTRLDALRAPAGDAGPDWARLVARAGALRDRIVTP